MSYASLGSGSPSAKGSGGSNADAKATDGRSGVNLPRLSSRMSLLSTPTFLVVWKENCISTQKTSACACTRKEGG